MTERTWIIETPEQLMRLAAYLPKVSLERPQEVILREYQEQRSGPQNSRLWKLHTLASGVTGCSPARMHEDMLCEHYGYSEKRLPSGDLERIPLKRSSQRDKKEFGIFMEFVESFYGQNLGVWLEVLG